VQAYRQKPVPITICSAFFITILREVSGITIGGIVGLDIFFLAIISGASMNPARSLAPALVSGVLNNLWIYRSPTFIGTSAVGLMFRKMVISKKS
jgi:aquaporin Z